MFMWTNRVCPKCGEWYYDIIEPEQTDNLKIKCLSCDWRGNHEELITKEEYKNKNRTKLIERMLEK